MLRGFIFWFTLSLLVGTLTTKAQTTTIVSGNWSDATIWSNGIPGGGTATTANYPVILDQNIPLVGGVREINISTGYYTFSDNVTDIPDGTNIELSIGNGGTLDVTAGTTTFLGPGSFDNGSSLYVRSGATLILGSTSMGNNVTILIEAGGTLIINGDLTSGNNNGTFTIAGLVYVNGNFSNGGTADVVGTGDIITTGTMDNNSGSATIFGSNNSCPTGPCSGQNLCGFINSISGSQTICSGTSASDLTSTDLTDASSPITYLWEYSTTSSTTGFSSAPGTNDAESYSPGTLTQTTWLRRKLTNGSTPSCTGTSPPVQITVVSSSAGGWIGATSSDWNDATNWCSGTVPTSTTDVTIPSGVTNSPEISTAASARNITINSDATLTISGSATLSVYGDITNNGTFDPGDGTVSFVGSTLQTLSSGYLTFNSIVFNNSAGVVFDALAAVSNQITMTAGILNLSSNNLTLNGSTLTYNSGWLYNGAFTRSLPGSSFNPGRLFPMGTSSDYRPFQARRVSGSGNAGTLRVNHTGTTTTTDVSITDAASTIVRRQESSWSVSNSGLTGGSWTITAGGTGLGTVGALSDLRVVVGSSNPNTGNHGTATGVTTDFLVTRTTLAAASLTNTFYIGSIDATQTPLPVHLLGFSGYFISDGIKIEWTTATEYNFDHFLLERSTNVIDFEPIARITGQGGHNIKANYSYLDESALSGRFYYRLKSIDVDESFSYSKIISVTAAGVDITLAIYPNPVNQSVIHINLNENSSGSRLTLHDELGKIHIDCSLNYGDNEIPVTGLPNGMYIARIWGNSLLKTIKLMVAR